MDVEIAKRNGKVFRLSDYGVVQDFVVNSIDKRTHREDIEGRPGTVNYGSYDGDRTITVPFIFKAHDLHDYAHLRDELYGLLDDGEPFYIREMRRLNYLQYEFVDFGKGQKWSPGTEDSYVNGKQILVRLNSVITPEQQFKNGNVDLEFISDELPYFESIYTTLELHGTGYSSTAEKYGLVDNIDDEKVKYRFTENQFTVYNAGNVSIEPESMYLSITLGMVVTDNVFRLTNKTTGETFEWQKPVDGRNIYIRGMNVSEGTAYNGFRNTNRRFISLVPGDNEFEVSGGTFSQISFDFKYQYK